MNVYTEARDVLDEPVVPRKTGRFYARYDGYRLGWVTFKGSITTPEEAREMAAFFKVLEQALKV